MDRRQIDAAFRSAVNMTADELEAWLTTEQSKRVGFRRHDDAESVGHASGRRIVCILRTAETNLADGDYTHMRKVVGFVHRHRAQRPENIYTSRWRYSLMNWGHDPTKEA
jgi:hypothetical protein